MRLCNSDIIFLKNTPTKFFVISTEPYTPGIQKGKFYFSTIKGITTDITKWNEYCKCLPPQYVQLVKIVSDSERWGFGDGWFESNKLVFGNPVKIWESEVWCEEMVKNNGFLLSNVTEKLKTEKICNLAIANTGYAIRYVKNPSPELKYLAKSISPWIINSNKCC